MEPEALIAFGRGRSGPARLNVALGGRCNCKMAAMIEAANLVGLAV
jgi:hypothetical protein